VRRSRTAVPPLSAERSSLADPGCLFHWATERGDGLTVTDVWTSQEAFEGFAAGKLGSVMEEVGIAKPEIKFVDVASYLTAGS